MKDRSRTYIRVTPIGGPVVPSRLVRPTTNGTHGMNWIRKERRLAIYIRDGLACCYCGASVEEDGVKLTLDHLVPRSKDGSNGNANLITCCHRCNSSRGNRRWQSFAEDVARYLDHGVTAEAIVSHIKRQVKTYADVDAAKALMKRRGSFTAALKGDQK